MAKQVRFDPSNSAIGRPHHRDGAVVDGESTANGSSSNCWLTDEDYNRIRRGIKKDVRKARACAILINGDGGNIPPPSLNEDETTLRGIEHLQSREVLQQLVHLKDGAIEAVFREQERQATLGRAIDGRAIAKVYMVHARQARQDALARAASDEAFVLADRKSTTTTDTLTEQQYLKFYRNRSPSTWAQAKHILLLTTLLQQSRKDQQGQHPQEAPVAFTPPAQSILCSSNRKTIKMHQIIRWALGSITTTA